MIQLEGLERVKDAFTKLDIKVQRKVARKALRAGAKMLKQVIQMAAPVGKTGLLKKNVKVRGGRANHRGDVAVVVGVGKKWFQGNTFYAGFIEFGHKIGPRELGDNRKEYPAHDFIKAPFEANQHAALNDIVDEMISQMDKAAQESK
jgi:HK97 gp10 family phage protein